MNEAASTGWAAALVGLPWWLVLPGAAFAAWAILRLARAELGLLAERARRGLAWLRGAVVVVVLLLLLEPTLTRTSTQRDLPAVAVLIDRSASMAVNDAQMPLSRRLDDAVALGFVDGGVRSDGPRRARHELLAFAADLARLGAGLATAQEASAHGAVAADPDALLPLAALHAAAAQDAARALAAGTVKAPEVAAFFVAERDLLTRYQALLRREGGEHVAGVAAALAGLGTQARTLLPRLDADQAAADQALLADAAVGPAARAGLERLGKLSRFERARLLTRSRLLPLLAGASEVDVFAIDEGGLTRMPDLAGTVTPPAGTTDFAAPFSTLARKWADQQHVGGVVLLSDGRQTAGGDPLPAVRALAARGARLAGVAVGDVGTPRDAVVADLQAPAEVFRGETVRLDVRFRITGYPDRDWALVLSRDGAVVDRRTVRGTGQWQTERFEQADAEAGVHAYQARLERIGAPSGRIAGGGGLLREVWAGIKGYEVHDFTASAAYGGKPDRVEVVPGGEVIDNATDYGARLRGYLIAPDSGTYSLWLSGDDKAELWLAPGAEPRDLTKVAEVTDWVDRGVWDKYRAQRSREIPFEKGQAYYFEVLHKQSAGAGHVAIGWTRPDGQLERPLPAARLAPFSRDANGQPTVPDDEAEASLANNQADCSVAVNDDPLKVLVVDASPRWESRFLVDMFERDKRVEVERRYRTMRTAGAPGELLPRTQEALDAYDLVVIGDLAPGELTVDDQQRLERFVARRGGFVVAIAGPRGMPAGYGLGGLANLLPVRIIAQSLADGAPTAVTLGRDGRESPIVAVLDDVALNQQLWPALPPLQWLARNVAAKEGAEVLLEARGDQHIPVVATSRYGAGRTLWVGSPETWRWRDRLGDRVHQTFWLQAIRWGLGIRLRGKDPRLQAALDRTLIAPHEGAELRVRARHRDGTPASGSPRATLQRLDEQGRPDPASARELELSPVKDADGLWHLPITELGEGHWRIAVTSGDPDLAGLVENRDLVVRAHQTQEGLELGADLANLSRLAVTGGFRADTLDQAEDLVRDLAAHLEPHETVHRATHTLWDNYAALLIVLGLLATEWVWRKRVGLP